MSVEIDYNKLKKTGIKLEERDYTKGDPQKMFCPDCHKKRKKHPKDKPLAVYWDSCYAKCFNCGSEFFFGKTEKIGHQPTKKPTMKKETKEYKKPAKLTNETVPDEKVLAWFASRGIPAEVVLQAGITQAARTFQQNGSPVKCILFPYFVEGELVNRKYRDGAKHFMLESGAELVPWHIDSIRDTLECIITEGEMDALSFIVEDGTM